MENKFKYKHRVDFYEDKNFISKLKELAQHSYLDTSSLLDREIKHCKKLFYVENENGALVCFAMYNFEPLEDIETVYYGLTVCAENYKSYGLAKCLWEKIAFETIQRQNEIGLPILCWLTTPTPIVFQWFSNFLLNTEPFLDGSYSDEGKQLAEKLQVIKYSQSVQQDINPFILRKIASNTIYSITAREQLVKATKKLNITAFENHTVDETKGDRFLIIGWMPKNVRFSETNI